MTRPLEPCGTEAAYNRHRKEHEDPCEACRAAHAAYHRDYRAELTFPAKTRRYHEMAARYRALKRLADMEDLREEFDALVDQLRPAGMPRWKALKPARTRLAAEHPDDYARLRAEERAKRGLNP